MSSLFVAAMKRNRVLSVLVGVVFCVAVMSLYRMLELMQGAEPQRHGETHDVQVDEVRHRAEGFHPAGPSVDSGLHVGLGPACRSRVSTRHQSVLLASLISAFRTCPASSRRLTGWSGC